MNFVPDSEVYLLNVPIEQDNKNQLYFSSKSKQTEYFESRIIHSFNDFTYVRQDGVISVPVDKESLYNCNYVMYRNKNFGTKWFYAFIDRLEYKNPQCTHIHIVTDCWQTWCFDIDFKKSWVRRMHEAVDTIGYNLMPEPVEIGEQRIEQGKDLWNYSKMMIVVASAVDLSAPVGDEGYPRVKGGIYNGVYSGSALFAWDIGDIDSLNIILNSAAGRGQANSITGIYMLPFEALRGVKSGERVPNNSNVVNIGITSAYNHGTFGGYVPKNNKLYTFPYSYTLVSNNNGSNMELHNEFFNGTPLYYLQCDCSDTATLDLRTANYNNDSDYLNHVSITGLPLCSWNYDAYLAWKGSQGASVGINAIGGVLSGIAKGVAVGSSAGVSAGVLTGVSSGIGSVAGAFAEYSKAKHLPDTAQGTVSGTFLLGSNRLRFRQYTVCCRYEFAKQIDDFFSRYGYAVNQLHDIQLGTRNNWNYIETQDVNIIGTIPNEDLQQIKDMFNKGITFWNNPETFGDYSQDNSPV